MTVSGVAYRFTSGRASALLRDELGDFSGTLDGDGLGANCATAERSPGEITLGGCWAHTTRMFRDAA
ncbi:MAG TPA: IS66 family transposase, partial [bacterium]|nr:IS66 family transposase [bacterium]